MVATRGELVGVLDLGGVEDADLDQPLLGGGALGARVPDEVVAPQVGQDVQAVQTVRVVEEGDAVAHRVLLFRVFHPVQGGREQAAREHPHEVAHLDHQLLGSDVQLQPPALHGARHQALALAEKGGDEVGVRVLGGPFGPRLELLSPQGRVAQEAHQVVATARVLHEPLGADPEQGRDRPEDDVDARTQLGVHPPPHVVEARPVRDQVGVQADQLAVGRTLVPVLLEIGQLGRLVASVLRLRRGVAPLPPDVGQLVALLDDERLGVEAVQVPLQEREQLGVDAVLIEHGQTVLADAVAQARVRRAVITVGQGQQVVHGGSIQGHGVLQKERVAAPD